MITQKTEMKTITFNGNQYECKRYSLKELEKHFNGYIVVLEDAKFYDMSNLKNGILVDVFDISKKIDMRKRYLLEDKKYTLWDLSQEPLFASYTEIG